MRPSMLGSLGAAFGAVVGISASAIAGVTPVDALRNGLNASFDIRFATIAATGAQNFNQVIEDEDAPPLCAPKDRGSLNITVDLADLGFPASVPVTLVGTALSSTRVQWDANVLINQCVPVTLPDGTPIDILIRRVIMRLTADAAFQGVGFDQPCAQRRGVFLNIVEGDPANFIDVEAYGLCLVFPFTRIDVAVRSIDSIGLAGDDPCPGDTNGDNIINFADLNAVLSDFGLSGAPGQFPGDVNADGVVNFSDLNTGLSAFGSNCAD